MIKNFHLPLPLDLYKLLQKYAKEESIPLTKLVRDVVEEWLEKRRRKAVQAEFRAFAEKYAGTRFDLDKDLERAGLESLQMSGL